MDIYSWTYHVGSFRAWTFKSWGCWLGVYYGWPNAEFDAAGRLPSIPLHPNDPLAIWSRQTHHWGFPTARYPKNRPCENPFVGTRDTQQCRTVRRTNVRQSQKLMLGSSSLITWKVIVGVVGIPWKQLSIWCHHQLVRICFALWERELQYLLGLGDGEHCWTIERWHPLGSNGCYIPPVVGYSWTILNSFHWSQPPRQTFLMDSW